MQETASFYEQL